MDSIPYSWLLAIVIALPVIYILWRLLGPLKPKRLHHQQACDPPAPDDTSSLADTSSSDDLKEDYVPIGWYQVIEAKKLFRRLEQAGIDFHVEAPHMDPCRGDVAAASRHGAFGTGVEVMLYVHHQDLEKFDTVRDALDRDETEVDGPSLLEALRNFAVDHDLERTNEESDQRPPRD